tara:strand:+ start:461 stop:655 length:195 start_codon:yes stop_codon:yes gene_type:complete
MILKQNNRIPRMTKKKLINISLLSGICTELILGFLGLGLIGFNGVSAALTAGVFLYFKHGIETK